MAGMFEDCSHQNGICYWLDTDLMRLLGYSDYASFRKVVMKAIASCAGLDIDPLSDFYNILTFRKTELGDIINSQD